MNPHLRRLCTATAFVLALAAAAPAYSQKLELPQQSPAATIKQRVGLTDIQVEYSRPSVKGRKIFGGLLKYGEVWRTGANAATKITFSTPVKFGGTEVPAGTYGLFTIPEKSEWTVILNSVPGQWGSYEYDAKNDVVRVKAKPAKLKDAVETFTIDLNDLRDESATLNLAWANTRVPVKLQFDVVPAVVKQIEAAMSGAEKPYFQAGMFYLEHDLDINKAVEWLGKAAEARPDVFYISHFHAKALAKKGDKAAAIAAAKRSIELAHKDKNEVLKTEYIRLNEALIASLTQ